MRSVCVRMRGYIACRKETFAVKIAIVHDWLVNYAGGEKVLEQMLRKQIITPTNGRANAERFSEQVFCQQLRTYIDMYLTSTWGRINRYTVQPITGQGGWPTCVVTESVTA